MRVPIRKGGEFTHIVPDPYLTPGKFCELKGKLNQLKAFLPKAIEEVKRLAEMGDFSENAAYQIQKNIISHNSPTGSALMGKKIGDTVKIQLANNEVEFKIIKTA